LKILIVEATEKEVKPLIKLFEKSTEFWYENSLWSSEIHDIRILYTGIGIVATSYKLTKELQQKKYDLVINAGICGSYSNGLEIGAVVKINQDTFIDLGLENENTFTSIFETSLSDKDEAPFSNGWIQSHGTNSSRTFNFLPSVNGGTASTVSGSYNTIKKIQKHFDVDIESMEGAACYYVCALENIQHIAIRSVSNYVKPRKENQWDFELSVNNLAKVLFTIIQELNED